MSDSLNSLLDPVPRGNPLWMGPVGTESLDEQYLANPATSANPFVAPGVRASDYEMARQQIHDRVAAVVNATLGMTGSIEGWHGTPHVFPAEPGAPLGRFRDEAIGTGEGAQAYGYGHYVAGNPAVGENYQPMPEMALDNRVLAPKDFSAIEEPGAYYALSSVYARGDSNIKTALSDIAFDARKADNPQDKQMLDEAYDWLRNNQHRLDFKRPGSLYSVSIRPDEHELLDWDRPLGEQPHAMKFINDYLTPFDFEGHGSGRYADEWKDSGGELLYHILSQNLGSAQAASEALSKAGIPGIRYLDAGSRAAGEGTRNYVIFDPADLRITGRNGEALVAEPVDHDPFATAQEPPP